MLTNAGWMITGRVFIIQAGAMFGTTALGHFNLALRFVDVLRDSLVNIARRVALPVLSEHQHDRARFAHLYARYTDAAALLLVPVFAGILVTADLLVEVLLGPAWAPAAPLIRILSIGAMVGVMRLFSEVALSAAGWPVFNLVNVGLAFVVVNGSLALVGGLGIEAAAWCWISRHVLGFVATLIAIRTVIGLGPLAQMRISLGPLVATLTMMAAVWAVETRLPTEWGAPARLAALVALGVAVYAAAACVVAREAIRTLVRRRAW
jgi:O-antigen/teichoic acid export membrane protein